MTRHYSDDDLTLYYYGEGRRRDAVERHLAACASCAASYRDIAATLGMVATPELPERGDQYGLEVWQRIRHQLPERELGFRGWTWFYGFAAAAALVVIAFFAGQQMRRDDTRSPSAAPATASNDADAARRVLLTSVADHLDRSERVLTDIMNAPARSDISDEQRWADDLLSASRLYRQDAISAGETSIAGVLDDLERNLVEIVHSPSKISAADLEQIRRRIDAAALLFKVRVMSDQLRQREALPPAASQPRTSTRTIS